METRTDSIDDLQADSGRQSQALRKAVARRKLENLREDKALHWVIANVWDEPERAPTLGAL